MVCLWGEVQLKGMCNESGRRVLEQGGGSHLDGVISSKLSFEQIPKGEFGRLGNLH